MEERGLIVFLMLGDLFIIILCLFFPVVGGLIIASIATQWFVIHTTFRLGVVWIIGLVIIVVHLLLWAWVIL
ncbi:MAG: hypothetical protein KAR42_16170 [candidate division Zixibacteria bacterium]|nr:hypothetical protein [candidate division Zixibacteria bacterium]